MSNLATIVNNILADSGIDDLNVVVTTGSYSNPTWINSLDWSKITSTPTTLSGYGITDAVPSNRTLTINGTAFDLSADRSWSVGTVTSVGLSMPSAFSVTNTPVTTSGTLTVTAAGLATQYIRGDGQLANFPTTSGGGTAVSYYMNGSVNQGTFGGNTYYEFSKTAVVGGGTNFTAAVNGYIAQFITDPNDPDLLNIPAGNWEVYTFLGASTNSGSPSYYVELYKYDTGGTFTLIADTSSTPTLITGGTNVDLYITAIPVPSTSLNATDRLAIRVYVNPSGNTITLYTEGTRLAQVATTFSTGLTALNGLTDQVQYFATGTSGTDFSISSVTDTHTFNLPTASSVNRGALSATDWTTFNNKIGGSLVSGYIPKATGTNTVDSSELFQSAGLIGIGTTSPTQKLDVRGRIAINTSGQSFTVNNFYPSGGQGNNIFIGNGGQNGVYFSGFNAAWNTSLGINAFLSSTTGFQNTAIGYRSLETSTTGNNNVAVGASSMLATTSGTQNVAVGTMALGTNTTGQNNTAVGQEAGIYRVGGSNETSNNSIYLGYYTRASASGNNNEIVIGSQTDGNGSNSVTLGNSSITNTYLRGNINLNTVNAAVIDTDRFLVSDSGVVKYRTGAEVLSDIGAAASTSISGTTNYIPKFTSSSAIGNSLLQETSGNITLENNQNGSTWSIVKNNNAGSGAAAGLLMTNDGGDLGAISLLSSTNSPASALFIRTLSTNPLVFGTNSTERMRLDASGNLGIGTSSPAQKLQVVGGIASSAAISALAASTAFFDYNNGNARFAAVSGTTGAAAPILFSQYSSNGSVGRDAMTLDASGNLGLGVTPSAWSLGKAYEINSVGNGLWSYSNDNIYLNQNAYFNSGWKYATSATAAQYIQFQGQHFWQTAPSGTAGNAISFTQAMTLDASGRLGIGTTSPAVKLDVIEGGTPAAASAGTVARFVTAGGSGFDALIGIVGGTSGRSMIDLGDTGSSSIGRLGYDHTADFMFFQTNGSERMRLDALGNLGVGTSVNSGARINAFISEAGATPNAILRLQNSGNSYTARMILTDGVTNDGVIGYQGGSTSATQYLGFGLGVTPTQMILTAAGNVGIGTTSPSNALTIFVPSSSSKGLMLSDGTDVASFTYSTITGENRIGGLQSYVFPTFYSGGSERMRITSGGEVGIGTSNPNVYGLGFTNQFTVSTTSGYANITVAGSSGNSGGIDFGNQTVRHAGVYGLDGSNLGFYTNGSNSGSGLTERMRITSGGNVLIASSVDSGLAKLQVTGSIQQTSVTSSLVKTDGNGVLVAATAGTDYLTATNSNFTYNASVTLSTSWQDTGVDNTNLTTSGVYIVTCYVDDFGVSGGQYQVTYTGIMYWFATSTNDTNVSEIALHHMGHADNNRYIYLRTRTTPSAAGTYLQIKGNGTNSGASTYIFTFKRLL